MIICYFHFAKLYIYFLIDLLFCCFYIDILAISTILHIDLYEIVKGGRPVFLLFVAPLLVVPTELTEYTEAYGLIFLESTERIDAKRHTTEGTEMIA